MSNNSFDDYTMNPCPKCSFPLLKDGTCSRCDHGNDTSDNLSDIRRRQEEEYRRGGPFGDGRG